MIEWVYLDERVRDKDQIRAIRLYVIEFAVELVYSDDRVRDIRG